MSTYTRKRIIINMSIKVREQIKSLLASKNVTMKELCKLLSDKLGKEYSLPNFSGKLKRGTISYNEVLLIAEILGYEIKFVDIEDYS